MRQIDSNVVVYKWSVTKRTRRNNEWESIYRYVVDEKQPKPNLLLNHNFFSCWNAVQFSLGSFLFDSIWFIALFRRLQFTWQTHAAHKLSLRTNKNVRHFFVHIFFRFTRKAIISCAPTCASIRIIAYIAMANFDAFLARTHWQLYSK